MDVDMTPGDSGPRRNLNDRLWIYGTGSGWDGQGCFVSGVGTGEYVGWYYVDVDDGGQDWVYGTYLETFAERSTRTGQVDLGSAAHITSAEVCPICRDGILSAQLPVSMTRPCGHAYHTACCQLKNGNICWVCNQQVIDLLDITADVARARIAAGQAAPVAQQPQPQPAANAALDAARIQGPRAMPAPIDRWDVASPSNLPGFDMTNSPLNAYCPQCGQVSVFNAGASGGGDCMGACQAPTAGSIVWQCQNGHVVHTGC